MYDRIVIAVDGSDEATHAARRGFEFARVFDATVTVIHVVKGNALQLARTAEERTQVRERGRTCLREIKDLASKIGHPVSTELVEGKPAARISEFAAERNADLIVVGRQGMTGVRKRLLGGVTEQVLRRSDVPVFVAPGENPPAEGKTGYSRILLPTDGSENAEEATPHAAAIARNYGSEVHVLNVVDLQAAGGVFNAGGLETEFTERLEARGREAVDEVLTEMERAAGNVTVKAAVERTSSYAGATGGIREYVAENEIDLVVMGSHGRSNLERQLIGSVASTVLRTVDVPVLVVKRTG
jgi:nucleotide-binding universal stress UspA family protein